MKRKPVHLAEPVWARLRALQVQREAELQRRVTLSEIVDERLTKAEGLELLGAHAVLADRKPVQP